MQNFGRLQMRIVALLVVLLALGSPSLSWAIEGFSGSYWGIGIYDSLEENPKTLGSIRQGIDWFRVYDTEFSTYAKFRYRFQRVEAEFNDAYGPALGFFFKRGPFRLGWEYVWERQPGKNETDTKANVYLDWYFAWDIKDLIKVRETP